MNVCCMCVVWYVHGMWKVKESKGEKEKGVNEERVRSREGGRQ